MTIIGYGTKSAPKMASAAAAVKRIDLPITIIGFNTKTGEMEQPLSRFGDPVPFKEGMAGAATRAVESLSAIKTAEYGLGIESMLVEIDMSYYLDIAVACMLRRGDPMEKATYATSQGIMCPAAYVRDSLASGRRVTAGKFFAAAVPGVDHADWHRHITGGRISRADMLADTIFAVFSLTFPSPS